MKKKLFFVFLGMSIAATAQVGVGTTNPRAALEVNSTTNGFLAPQIALTNTTIAAPVVNPAGGALTEGTIVYNTATVNDVTPGYYYWNGTIWVRMAAGAAGGSHNTLDMAYDEGGSGAGRTITADAGSVTINNQNAATHGLVINNPMSNTAGIQSTVSTSGVAIWARSTSSSNAYSTIQAETNNTASNTAAVVGITNGAAAGISGEVSATATATAAVNGSNLRTTGGHGVYGQGFNGVVGVTNYRPGYGVWGQNYDALGSTAYNSVGTYGYGYVGLWGDTTDTYAIVGNGIVATYVGFQNLSDQRLKSNIERIDSPLEKLGQISGNYYDIEFDVKRNDLNGEKMVKHHKRKEYGVIAQEVEKVFPEMIKTMRTDYTQPEAEEYKTVNYTQLIPVLIEAVKELNEEVKTLKAEIKQLKE